MRSEAATTTGRKGALQNGTAQARSTASCGKIKESADSDVVASQGQKSEIAASTKRKRSAALRRQIVRRSLASTSIPGSRKTSLYKAKVGNTAIVTTNVNATMTAKASELAANRRRFQQ